MAAHNLFHLKRTLKYYIYIAYKLSLLLIDIIFNTVYINNLSRINAIQ